MRRANEKEIKNQEKKNHSMRKFILLLVPSPELLVIFLHCSFYDKHACSEQNSLSSLTLNSEAEF